MDRRAGCSRAARPNALVTGGICASAEPFTPHPFAPPDSWSGPSAAALKREITDATTEIETRATCRGAGPRARPAGASRVPSSRGDPRGKTSRPCSQKKVKRREGVAHRKTEPPSLASHGSSCYVTALTPRPPPEPRFPRPSLNPVTTPGPSLPYPLSAHPAPFVGKSLYGEWVNNWRGWSS